MEPSGCAFSAETDVSRWWNENRGTGKTQASRSEAPILEVSTVSSTVESSTSPDFHPSSSEESRDSIRLSEVCNN